jgi:hypothetical protein
MNRQQTEVMHEQMMHLVKAALALDAIGQSPEAENVAKMARMLHNRLQAACHGPDVLKERSRGRLVRWPMSEFGERFGW